jgi:hypothetical protein
MSNLLAETISAIVKANQRIATVVSVRSVDGRYATTWEEYATIADHEYDSGYGSPQVAEDLVIEFQDGSYLWRNDYDGSEWWDYTPPLPPVSPNPKQIETVFGEYWPELEAIHETDDNE